MEGRALDENMDRVRGPRALAKARGRAAQRMTRVIHEMVNGLQCYPFNHPTTFKCVLKRRLIFGIDCKKKCMSRYEKKKRGLCIQQHEQIRKRKS